ncbi:hypothetical protein NKJ72_01450 [Mesorhizobium sp. M0045]|uniref:hypothetical protein n=1 Tax=Mesorhizobium sp. M0045 TaxID=2956857 RepID=UPI00333B7A41
MILDFSGRFEKTYLWPVDEAKFDPVQQAQFGLFVQLYLATGAIPQGISSPRCGDHLASGPESQAAYYPQIPSRAHFREHPYVQPLRHHHYRR